MLASRVLDALRREDLTIALAESCTGGLLGARLTDEPGASDVLRGGVISYTDEVKADLLGVDRATLREIGGVSREVARQMAVGARERLGADLGVSITGFAGPKVPPGGELGRVFIGLAHAGGVDVHDLHFPEERRKVREGAVEEALRMILDAIPHAARARR